ncbi:MAG: hypothetical protein BGP05_19525 [Rhizobiales bacterium 62-47]|jgi:hypothetical protein|nr:hypothetical protein [Hyphomicrobiales bacterium]OJY09950.1 MAG: hypothetical protein BGP05_19525 [Rhizobiales bacterium 62-47]
MRRPQRLIAAAVLLSLAGALAGCSGSMSNFDPTDMFDFLDTKKKLPGERKPVFPEGVPGLEQGVPKELYKDNVDRSQLQDPASVPAVAAAPAPAPEPKAKSSSKSRTRSRTAPAAAPAEPDASSAAEEGSTVAAPPAPKPAKSTARRRSTTAPPPDAEPAQPPASAPQAQPAAPGATSPSPFPAPLPSGSFQR